MKALKIIEKVLFILAVVFTAIGLVLVLTFEGNNVNVIIACVEKLFPFGFGSATTFLLLGAMLKYNENKLASTVGKALVLITECVLFGIALYVTSNDTAQASSESSSNGVVTLLFIGSIIYFVSLGASLIIYVCLRVKPQKSNNPEDDPVISQVIMWKNLEERGIITKEEFEKKRVEILGLNNEQKDSK